jgi:nitroreductase
MQDLREFARTLRGRRTINLYLHLPVPDKLIHEAIEVATWAPNHHVTEPWRFYTLGPETIARCVDLVRDMVSDKKGEKAGEFKANSWAEKPGWVVVTCQQSDDEALQQEDYGACCAAVQNLLLYLWKAGVGSKWTSGDITRDPRFFDIVGIDGQSEFVVGLIWYGYAKVTPEQQRRPLQEVLTSLP